MIAATITAGVTSQSLRDHIEASTPGQISAAFSGRVCEIQFQWVSDVINIHWKEGTVGITDNGARVDVNFPELTLRCTRWNNLSIDDIFVSGGGATPTARVLAYTV